MNKDFDKLLKKEIHIKKKIMKKTFKERIQTQFFDFFIYIIKTQRTNKILDAICVFLELCQMMSFPLHPRFGPVWRYDSLFTPISQYLQFFLIAPIFKGSGNLYVVFLYLIVLVVLGNFAVFLYASVLISKNNFSQAWPFYIMSFILSLVGNVIFLPLLQILLSILYCDDNDNSIYAMNYKCWEGVYFLHTTISLISIILLIGLSLFYISVCFDIRQNSLTNSSKRSTYPDVCLILLKIYLSIVNTALNGKGFNIYIMTLSFILCSYVAYLYWYMSPYYSKVLTKLYYISTFSLCWGYAIIVFTLLIEDLKFNGGFPLLIIGIIIVVITILFSGKTVDFRLFRDMHTGEEYRNMLVDLEIICDVGETERKYRLVLYAYIQKFEETCISPNCFLKQYLIKREKALLYYHLETLYQQGISLYPDCIAIKMAYIMMLIDKMKKIRKAKGELEKLTDYPNKRLNDTFALFYLNKIIELFLQEGTNKKDNETDITFIQYKSLVLSFKSLITKIASHYLEFWNMLLVSKTEFQEDLTKLNDLGSIINTLLEEIDNKLAALQKIKKYDEDIIRIYTDFLSNILNNKALAKEFYNKLINASNGLDSKGDHDGIDDKELLEENFLSLLSKKDRMFIILSTQSESFGHIIHISLGLTSRLGYLNEELIGHSINMIIPEIFTKYHQSMLKETFNSLKNKMIITDQNNATKTVQNNKTVKVFALTKSKYIIPIAFQVIFIQNENGNYYFIAKFIPEYSEINIYDTPEESCYVLTDAMFRIKNYTSNAIRLLGLTSYEMNGSSDITHSIKEFNEQHLKNMINKSSNDKSNNHNEADDSDDYGSSLDYNEMKSQLLTTFIGKKTTITWKHYIPTNVAQGIGGSVVDTNITNKIPDINMFFNSNIKSYSGDPSLSKRKEQTFLIGVTEQHILRHTVGYAFRFDSNMNSMMILNKKSIIRSSLCSSIKSEKIKKVNRKNSISQPAFVGEKKVQLLNSINSNSFVSFNEIDNADDFFQQKTKSTANQRICTSLGHRVNIDKTYVPKNTLKFVLNIEKNAFQQYNTHDKSYNITEMAMNKAYDYLNDEQQEQEESLHETTEEDDSDYDYTSSNSISSDADNGSIVKEREELKKLSFAESPKKKPSQFSMNYRLFSQKAKDSNNITIDYWNEYYHVNMENIRLTIYDFVKKIPIEPNTPEGFLLKSEVNKRLSQDDSLDHEGGIKNSFGKDAKIAQQSSLHRKTKKQSRNTKVSSTSLSNVLNEDSNENMTKRQILLRQIDLSLNKKETHFIIILFQMLSLLCLIILLSEAGVTLGTCLNHQNKITEIMILLTQSGEMIIDIINSIYFAREITLINVDNYTNIYQEDRKAYLANCSTSLYELFDHYSLLQSTLSTSSNTLNDPNFMILYNETVLLKSITNEYNSEFFNVSIYTSFILHQLSLFRLSQTEASTLIPSQKDIYFFIYNSNNVNVLNHGIQTQVFFDQIVGVLSTQRIILAVLVGIMVVLHSLLFIGMKSLYRRVTEKKVCYLEVFLEIENIILTQAYNKCDAFLNKIQLRNSQLHSKYSNDDVSTIFFDDDLDMNNFTKKDNQIGHSNHKYNSTTSKKNKIASETRNVTIFFLAIMIITYLITFGIITYYCAFIINIGVITSLFQTQLSIEIMTLMAFNLMREFIVEPSTLVYGLPAEGYIQYILTNYTTIIKELQDNFEQGMTVLPYTFQEDYHHIQKKNICDYSTDFFSIHMPDYTCANITNQAGIYGLKSIIAYYFEELRFLKNLHTEALVTWESFSWNYNFTYLKTPIGDSYWPSWFLLQYFYFTTYPLTVFNEDTHLQITFIHRFLLLPAFNDIMLKLYSAIESSLITVRQILIYGTSAYIILLILFYIFIWKPFEIKLNSTIYKTKRMLSIIPREVLVSIKNIHILLELDSKAITDNII